MDDHTRTMDDRVILRKRVYKDNGKYSEWEDVKVRDVGSEHFIKLNCGGVVKFMPSFLNKEDCRNVAATMENQVKYHQYRFNGRNGCHDEPRIHTLLSPNVQDSGDVGPGYQYHQ